MTTMKEAINFLWLLIVCLKQASVQGDKSEMVVYSSQYADTEIQRAYIPLNLHKWGTKFAEYEPPQFTDICTLQAKCDPDAIRSQELVFNKMDTDVDRRSKEGKYIIDITGHPLNPRGRTGISGRGVLPRWGPNYYVALVAIRNNNPYEILTTNTTEYNMFDMLKLPGEFVDNPDGIIIPPKMRTMLAQNLAAQQYSPEAVQHILTVAEEKARKFYSGFIRDERNTDNSWVEIIVYQTEDIGIADIGLFDPKVTPETKQMHWKELELFQLATQLERIIIQSKLTGFTSFRHKLVRSKERRRQISKKQKATMAFRLFSLFTELAGMGIGFALLG